MTIKEELKFAWKILYGFAINTVVGFILYAMVAVSVKYAFILYYYLFQFQDNATVLMINKISTYISAIFFVLYLFISLTKFTIEQYYELKKFIKKTKNES
ncbi:MAG: hypothetical protein KAT43_01340 [Nanoarchaeota archaeon]|nr:hypothetical protein [Nanoarchaeota archaeon]